MQSLILDSSQKTNLPVCIFLGPQWDKSGKNLAPCNFIPRMVLQKAPMTRYGTLEAIQAARNSLESLSGRGASRAREIFARVLQQDIIRSCLCFGPHRAEMARLGASLTFKTIPIPMDAEEARKQRGRLSFVMARQQKITLSPLYEMRRKFDRLVDTGISPSVIEAVPEIMRRARNIYRDLDPLDAERKNALFGRLCICGQLYREAQKSQRCATLQDAGALVQRLQRLMSFCQGEEGPCEAQEDRGERLCSQRDFRRQNTTK